MQKLPYVTSVGDRVSTLVTDLGIFEKRGGRLVLTRLLGVEGRDTHTIVERIRASCGWALEVADDLVPAARPTADELFRIRLYDPRGEFLTSTRN